jgi:hypothetical protein
MSVQPPSAVPETGPHPEEVQPLGAAHPMPSDEKRVVFILSIALCASIVLVPIAAGMSVSPFVNVLLGLSPLIITIILDMVATMQHYKPSVYWGILLAVHALALAVLYFISFLLPTPINVTSAVSLSVILALLVTVLCILVTGKSIPEPKQKEELESENIQAYVQSIEDKAKAMNFVIGRVYRASNGGTKQMRERLRVPSEWYNEFQTIQSTDPDEKLDQARTLVRKIRDRLSLYVMRENEVFTVQEVATLKHIARRRGGEDTILSVLATNDQDPVEHYYASAVEFCDKILK